MTYRPVIPNPLTKFASYRGYKLRMARDGVRVSSALAAVLPAGVMQSCTWTAREDTDGLADYLDLSLQGKTAQTSHYEERGFAVNVVLAPEQPHAEVVRLSLDHLLDALAMTDHVCIPLWGRVRFTKAGNSLVPMEMIAILRERHPERFGHLKAAEAVSVSTDAHLPDGVSPEDVHSGMNIQPGVPQQFAAPAPAVPPAEVQLSRNSGDGWLELVSMVSTAQPYFVRRIVSQNRFIYVATAWSATGPWNVEQRDPVMMMALGLR